MLSKCKEIVYSSKPQQQIWDTLQGVSSRSLVGNKNFGLIWKVVFNVFYRGM